MDTSIITAIIEASATIIAAISAAIIAAVSAKRIVKESLASRFRSYSDKSHDVTDILIHAQNDVFIVAAIGDIFLGEYFPYIEKLLNRKIKVKYLLLSENELKKAEYYFRGEEIDIAFRKDIINRLEELELRYADLFELREFNLMMPASYICVDTMLNPPTRKFISSSVIQAMLYQYKTLTKESPITYISPRTEEKEYLTTVQCIKQMWEDAAVLKPVQNK